ncbi:MAG: hypothetical protein K2Y08_03270 [Alphaproteobacteria bacterium]|nr:hypothetical protein [Alphaproteobacteria bacterium]
MFIRIISLILITSLVFGDIVRAMEPGDAERIHSRRHLPTTVLENIEDEERVQRLLQHQQKLEEEERQWLEILEALESQKTNHDQRQEELRKEETQIREDLAKIALQKQNLLSEKQRQEEDENQWLENRQQEENKLQQEEEDYQHHVEEARINREGENNRHQQEFESQKVAFQFQEEALLKNQKVAQKALQKIELLEKEFQEEQSRNAQLKTDENASANTEEEKFHQITQKLHQRQDELKQEKKDTQEVLKRVREEQEKLRHEQDTAKEKEQQRQAQRLLVESQLTEEAATHRRLVEDARLRREEEDGRHKQTLKSQKETLRHQEEELHETERRGLEELRNLSLQQEIFEGEKTKWAENVRTIQQKLDVCRLEKERDSTSSTISSTPSSVLSSSPPSTLSSDLSKSSKTTSSPSSSPEKESLISEPLLSKRGKKKVSPPNNEKTPLLSKGDLSLQDINTWLLIERTNEEQIPCLNKKQTLLAFVIPSEESTSVSYFEEQPINEEAILTQKAQLLLSKIEGTSLEDFARWYQGHVVENRYTWKNWGGIVIALVMAAGTGAAMSDIVEYSIYNSFFANHLNKYMPFVEPLEYYINISTALTSFVDSTSFMLKFTSPSTQTFTTPKGTREKRTDGFLISLAAITGIYLELFHFQITQAQKDFSDTTGWWNPPDRYLYFSSLGFFPYLVAQTWNGMRTPISNVFHSTIPEHVKTRVMALRQLDARLDHLSKTELGNLYDLLKNPLFASNSKFNAWALYLCQGEVEDISKIEGLLSYMALTKYAQGNFKKELEQQERGNKTKIASRILAGLGLPAGFSLVTISVFGVLSSFMDWKIALALSTTAAALGFIPDAFLQSHNVQDTLEAISLKKPKNCTEVVKVAAKVLGTAWAVLQNSLTNLAPIFVSLVMLIPEQFDKDATFEKVMTGVMITVAIPYLINELLSGTYDIWGHLVSITRSVEDFFGRIHGFILKCRKKEISVSPRQQKREIRRILMQAIEVTLRFKPEHVEGLDNFERGFEENQAVDKY